MSSNILDFFPSGKTPREGQAQCLKWVAENYDTHDIFLITIPVAGGKSPVAKTIGDWAASRGERAAILTPTRLLQAQYGADFPKVPNLRGKDFYSCVEGIGKTCADNKRACCIECPRKGAATEAKASDVAFYNYHTYAANCVWGFSDPETRPRDLLILDEAHNCADIIAGWRTMTLWQHIERWPNSIKTIGDLAIWLEEKVRSMPDDDEDDEGQNKKLKFKRFLQDIRDARQDFHFEIAREPFRGSPHYCIKVRPLTLRNLRSGLWTSTTKKLVMLSATMSVDDLYDLGLSRFRIAQFSCPSPIPPSSRPFIAAPTFTGKYTERKTETPKMAAAIKALLARHPAEKGLVHVTYGMAEALRPLLSDAGRLLWHDKYNKSEVYQQFRASEEPVVLMASGMDEGIDLVDDAGRWQAILTIPFPMIGDSWVKAKMERDPGWFNRETVRTILQQTGRICRTPSDRGVTYMLDNRFNRFYAQTVGLWTDWFKEARVFQGSVL